MKYVHFIIVLFAVQLAFAQNKLQVLVKSSDDGQPLTGANVYFDSLQIGASSDDRGFAYISNIPDGRHLLIVSYVGFQTKKMPLVFPLKKRTERLTILLEPAPFSSEQIVVSSTRNNSIVARAPVRIQVLGKEEVREETAIQPGNLSKFLGESSSIISQPTSLINGLIRFRLQGLPARYTQILKDGFPDFGGLEQGFSALQIPPLDLRQIEIMRGSFSPLYANGAVAGMINLISKKPTPQPHFELILNRTDKQGTDISSFFSTTSGKLGLTLLASQSLQKAIDVNHDGFSDFPQLKQTTLNPKLFYNFGSGTSLMIGLTSFFEVRRAGDMQAVQQKFNTEHFAFEEYSTKRLGLNVLFKRTFKDSSRLKIKSSWHNVQQTALFTTSLFSGHQTFNFNEISYFKPRGKHKFIGGLTLTSDSFHQQKEDLRNLYDYRFKTVALFVQDDWQIAPQWTLHGALRWDYRDKKNAFFLPHAAILFNPNPYLNFRISGGLGYYLPTLNGVFPHDVFYTFKISKSTKLHAEKSQDMAIDATYHLLWKEWALSLNQAVYATRVKGAQFAEFEPAGAFLWSDYDASLFARGAETHLVLNTEDFEFFIDYNFVKVEKSFADFKGLLPLTPKHKLNFTATYEKAGNWRSGIEAFYTGKQLLEDGTQTGDYFIFGLMFEKKLKYFSAILNIENVLDERQSKHEQLVTLQHGVPSFKTPYMPNEGRVINLALWFQL